MNGAGERPGTDHWRERPACEHGECTEPALSFARHCWEHLPDAAAYLAALRPRAATLEGFAGLNLAGARLKEVAGPRTNFAGARLRGVDLAGGDYTGASFEGADLGGASLRGATLAEADFTGADASYANLRGADLTRADLQYASFGHADLTAARVERARGEETDLSSATLAGAVLDGSVFRRVSFYHAELARATMEGTRLENCDLGGADVRTADLAGALFRETDVGRAVLPADLRFATAGPAADARAGEIYAELKLNFRQFGRFGLAERALYREMVARRRARRREAGVWPPFALFRDVIERVCLDLYAGYATKPWRVAYALVAAWFGFALYYYLLPFFGRMGCGMVSYIDPGGGVPPLADLSRFSFERSLYFSFVTLTKLGFTSYEPYGWAKVAAGVEGSFAIISYIVLLVMVARKIWR